MTEGGTEEEEGVAGGGTKEGEGVAGGGIEEEGVAGEVPVDGRSTEGALGSGQTKSRQSGGQNSRILLKR